MVTWDQKCMLNSRSHPINFDGERTLDLGAVFSHGFWPTLVYAIIIVFFSTRFAHDQRTLALILGAVFTILVLANYVCAFRQRKRQRRPLFWAKYSIGTAVVTLLTAWGVSVYMHEEYLERYYEYGERSVYPHVSSLTPGIQIQDAGRVNFEETANVTLINFGCFKQDHTYCVAPIVPWGNISAVPQDTSIDMWAVGLDCCDCPTGEYKCGQWNNPDAHSGLRVVYDDRKPYYRKAVEAWAINNERTVNTPLFFWWTADAKFEVNHLWNQAVYLMIWTSIALFAFFMTGSVAHDIQDSYFYNKAIRQNQEDERARIVDELEDAAYTNL